MRLKIFRQGVYKFKVRLDGRKEDSFIFKRITVASIMVENGFVFHF